jgi:class 3 adenylate cyclase
MTELARFGFRRARGIVWVCDIPRSSSFLNDNTTAGPLEEFLPRLYVVANFITAAAGGRLVKWTGDGFLSWFETPLHRDIETLARSAFWAARDLTFLVNVTQLGVKSEKKLRVRHGLMYEHDALVLNIGHTDEYSSIDLIGRGVVLANRLASVQAKYPSIVTHRELVQVGEQYAKFKFWRVSKDDRLKYFKGERWGTNDLYVSEERKIKRKSLKSLIRQGEAAIKKADHGGDPGEASLKYVTSFVDSMLNGPTWCRDVMVEETRFIERDLKGSLQQVINVLKSIRATNGPKTCPNHALQPPRA